MLRFSAIETHLKECRKELHSKSHSPLEAYIWVWSSEMRPQQKSPGRAHSRRKEEHDIAQESSDRTKGTKTGPFRILTRRDG